MSWPLPSRLTLHGLRHTYVSLRLTVDNPPDLAAIARDAGHADVLVTARVYSHVMAIGDGERDRLRALVEGAPLGAATGTNAVPAAREEHRA